jgi:very-short-patch-repair endonuclease
MHAELNPQKSYPKDPVSRLAAETIDSLPTYRDPDSFYDIPDVHTSAKRDQWKAAIERILVAAATTDKEPPANLWYWIADLYIVVGEYEAAIREMPTLDPGQRRSIHADKVLSLKAELGLPISGRDAVILFGPKLTKFGAENVEHVIEFIDIRIRELQEREERKLLSEWKETARLHPHGMPLFNAHQSYLIVKTPEYRSYSLSSVAERFCTELMRDAENTYREEADLPRVGEGWVAETALYYAVKEAMPNIQVIQHGREQWLGRQHLDVYLPELKVALEYQGEQHDRPVEFFGGEEAFRKNQQRDRRKLKKCEENGVQIIYVREGYDLDVIIEQIKATS